MPPKQSRLSRHNLAPTMSEPLSSASPVHIYRPPLWRRLSALAAWFIFLLFVGLPIGLFSKELISLAFEESNARPIIAGALCVVGPLALVLILAQIQLTAGVYSLFFANTLKITTSGLEYRFWPYVHVRCAWSDLDRVAKFLFTDQLYLQSYEVIGPSLSLKRFWRRLSFEKQLTIPLSNLAGWPNGGLAADLHLYAPWLFDTATGKPLIPASQPVDGPSKDERLYAALSHAGAWLFPVFLPLAFWLSERKKSAYVASQAKQALVFQFFLMLFGTTTAICLLAGVMTPVFLTLHSDRTSFSPAAFQHIYLTGMLLGGLVSLVQLGLLLYTGVAIVQSYQGADFRYPLFGKWIK